jgi:sugar transferase (PEP-CTERM/EpsH1 system associated)
MKKLLFLVHRLPFPPNKGDKICSGNILRYFSGHWRVHLGTFIDDPEDWQHVDTVGKICEDSCVVDLPRSRQVTGSLRGLMTGESLSLSYYRSVELQDWVRSSIERECPDAVWVYSGVMGRFVKDMLPAHVPVVFDAEDVDSEKWRSYSRSARWPLSWLYRREANKLLAYEREMAASTHASVFISEVEAEVFKKLAPESAEKIHFRINGVDSVFFDPEKTYENPYKEGQKVLVFVGAMDYLPNIEAVKWFCENVLKGILAQEPNFLFYIVGMKPTKGVQRLGNMEGVHVTGGVPDVRPYLSHALAACLPLQMARGIQNKALEAMSMALPVLATKDAMLGIMEYPGALFFVANNAEEMTKAALEILARPRQISSAGRDCVLEHYNWDANLKRMEGNLFGDRSLP